MLKMSKNWSIRWKLTFMAMATTTVAVALAVGSGALFEYTAVRNAVTEQQSVLAGIIGGNCTAAIMFNRADDATTTLETLRSDDDVRAAGIYDANGKLMAKYVAPDEKAVTLPSQPLFQGVRIAHGLIEEFEPVMLDGKPIGTIYMRSDLRDLDERIKTFAWAAPLVLVASSLVGLMLISRLQRAVSVPIVSLAQTARKISTEKDYTLRAPKHANDETGMLADTFNEMLDGIRQRDDQIRQHLLEVQSARDQLEQRVLERTAALSSANSELHGEMERRREAEQKREQMQADLVEASRKAGMADVATGVLHNVGNVLNSVNVSTQLAHDAVKSSRVSMVGKTAELLEQHASDLPDFLTKDERGKKLPAFLSMIAKALGEEQSSLLTELNALASSVGHIREIVAMQQSLARVSGVMTPILVGDLIEDSLKINQAGLQRHQVTIIRDFNPDETLTTDRHKVLQILINLVSNAKYAVDGSTGLRQITLRVRKLESDFLEISVVDSGVGIEPQNLVRIFGYGFTTKKNGHGFGLHSAALAAKELGGKLEVHSEGLGTGATFTLTLPRNTEALAHAG